MGSSWENIYNWFILGGGGEGECVDAMGEYTSTEWTEVEKEIESPPRLGLRTINSIFHGMIDMLSKHVSKV